MGAFKQTYKKVYETSISGATTELTVDNIFRPHNHYLIINEIVFIIKSIMEVDENFYLRHDGANDAIPVGLIKEVIILHNMVEVV